MIIRQATEEDISDIKRISDALQVSRDQPGWQTRTSGIFEYQITEQELYTALNPWFYVAETSSGIKGYSLACDSNFFRERYENTNHLELKNILSQTGDFLYWDQLGVLNPDSLGAGRIVNELADKTLRIAKSGTLEKAFAYVCEKPLHNQRSANFLKRKGFRKIQEVPIENQVVLAMYELSLK